MQIHHKFDMRGTVQDKDGKDKSKLTLTNLNHVPNSRFNLFSASQAVNQGWEVHVNSERALVSKGLQTLTFDRLINTGSSQLYDTCPRRDSGGDGQYTCSCLLGQVNMKRTIKKTRQKKGLRIYVYVQQRKQLSNLRHKRREKLQDKRHTISSATCIFVTQSPLLGRLVLMT